MSKGLLDDLRIRPRRLRRLHGLRDLVEEAALRSTDFAQPVFVKEEGAPEAVASMTEVNRLAIPDLLAECRQLHEIGIPAVALFPRISDTRKDAAGSEALREETLVLRAARAVKDALPELIVISDLALDPYTDHGHDGILASDGTVANDPTVEILAEMAVLAARAGVDVVAPSDMMDGRIGAIRQELDAAGHQETAIMAYSAKFSSAFYGPFRDAVGSVRTKGEPAIDKRTYQLSPANLRDAVRELLLDEREGADFLMVKPAGLYLDVISMAREKTNLPIAAYQVSGEYAQLQAASAKGWLDLNACMLESLLSIKRAGADIILTYFAKRAAMLLDA
jgi:porphobilinogen synthase